MSLIRSGNPVLSKDDVWAPSSDRTDVMTVQGAVWKTIFVLLLTMSAAAGIWWGFLHQIDVMPFMMVGMIGGTIIGFWNAFRCDAGPISTSLYACCEGLAVGGISAFVETRYPGLPMHAVALTFGVMFAILAAYNAGLVRATGWFTTALVAAMSGICLVYLLDFILMFVGTRVPFIHDSGPIGIAFSLFVVGIAALNLVLDFDFIERGAHQGAPKAREWYAAFDL